MSGSTRAAVLTSARSTSSPRATPVAGVRWVVDASTVVAYLLGEGSEVERGRMLGDVQHRASSTS